MLVSATPSSTYVDPRFGAQTQIRDYRYAVPVAQVGPYLDRALSWVVGACTGTATNTCSFSEPRQFTWSTRNLTAPDFQNIQRNSDGQTGRMLMDVVASSDGESDIGPFNVRVEFGEALIDSALRCVTDHNSPNVTMNDVAVTADGVRILVRDLRSPPPRSNPPRGAVVGILRSNSTISIAEQVVQVPFMPAAAASRTVAPGVTFTFAWGNPPETNKRFLGRISLDVNDAIAETVESDNVKAECLRVVSRG